MLVPPAFNARDNPSDSTNAAEPYDDLITLTDAVKYFPRPAGRKASVPTIYRWSLAGCRGVKLRTVTAGGVLCTRPEWCADFISALTAQRENQPHQQSVPRPSQSSAVKKQLDAIRI